MYDSPSLTKNKRDALTDMRVPRSSALRARRHKNAVLRAYRRDALTLGYTPEQVTRHIADLIAMDALHGWRRIPVAPAGAKTRPVTGRPAPGRVPGIK